ncbi:ABC transporter substrate-binding protein [Lysinibacillus yapensis]|uniref:ABC transporter substrate-binding protein n=1 Tax=Ureibacillus yapensis TaxID=2304605 RepID=A0A396S8P6_9BACL|nr:ABC transporter substrate-binding protein [Lysinibacillus yapensis]RHW37462.1 ABC transporter substrate-binding protein [Lysinibacillus yapensis]
MLILILFVLAACESGSNEPASKSESSNKTGEEGTPKEGGTLSFYDFDDPKTLDPHKSIASATNSRIGLVYNKLVTFATGPDNFSSDEIVPDLAKDWEISEDGKTYTFHLRDDVKWQNIAPVNGRAFTSEDVIATMERIKNLPGPQANSLVSVESIEAPDDYTVIFNLSEPYAPLLNQLASFVMWILPKEATEGKVDLDNTAIGTGPFILESWKRGVEASFKKNPDYFEEGKPYLDGVTIYPNGDSMTEVNAFRTGQTDVILTDSKIDFETLKKSVPDAQIQSEIVTASRLFINQTRKPLDNILVRQAMSKAIDREGAWKSIYGNGEYNGYVMPTLEDWALPLDERKEYQEYDPEGAKELLAEAGFPDGFEVSMIVTDGYGPQLVTLAEWVAEDLKEIGIKVNIEVLEYGTFFSERWPSKEYDIGIGLVTPVTDPSDSLDPFFKSDGYRNWQGVNDPKLDEMIKQQYLIVDRDERIKYINEIERYLFENVTNHVNLFAYHIHHFKQPYVKGFDPHSNYGYLFMKNVWLDK